MSLEDWERGTLNAIEGITLGSAKMIVYYSRTDGTLNGENFLLKYKQMD
jgi:hypothetical protein